MGRDEQWEVKMGGKSEPQAKNDESNQIMECYPTKPSLSYPIPLAALACLLAWKIVPSQDRIMRNDKLQLGAIHPVLQHSCPVDAQI